MATLPKLSTQWHQRGHMTTWETLLKLIWSYGEVFEFTQALDEGEEGKCNLRKSFKVIP